MYEARYAARGAGGGGVLSAATTITTLALGCAQVDDDVERMGALVGMLGSMAGDMHTELVPPRPPNPPRPHPAAAIPAHSSLLLPHARQTHECRTGAVGSVAQWWRGAVVAWRGGGVAQW